MSSTREHIDELIAKYLAGEASPEEAIFLDNWRDESEENNRHFVQAERLFGITSRLAFNPNAAWNSVNRQISNPGGGKVIGLWTGPLRIAAVLLALIGLGTALIYIVNSQTSTIRLASENTLLSDTLQFGDIVTLNKNSSMEIKINKRSKSTRIALSGEAYFDLHSGPEYETIVETGDLLIADIGTAFNVTAYDSNDTVSVQVVEGLVRMYTEESEGIEIGPGETGRYIRTEDKLIKSPTEDENALGWKTHNFRFTNATLKEVARTLNAVFESKIVVDQLIEHCRISVQFFDEQPEEIAEIIAETLGLEIEKEENQITLKGTGCVQ